MPRGLAPRLMPDLLHVLTSAGHGDCVDRAAAEAFVIVRTGERRPYGNVLLTEGVIGS